MSKQTNKQTNSIEPNSMADYFFKLFFIEVVSSFSTQSSVSPVLFMLLRDITVTKAADQASK